MSERSDRPSKVHQSPVKAGGGVPAIRYTLAAARESGGIPSMWRALRSKNTCKTCALGMGGQLGGMVNEAGHFPEVCKKSAQAMASDLQPAIPASYWATTSIAELQDLTPREIDSLGRLTEPLIWREGSQYYEPIEWSDAYDLIADQLSALDPNETFWYLSGRSSNEAAFAAQLFARLYGTNNVNNCSYYCHQASGVGLTNVIGSGTATVSLDDVEHADLVFMIGGNPASNHPRLMNTLKRVRRRGGQVIVINPIVETGLVRFRIPSDARSMISGSKIASEYIQPHIGGDLALFAGIAKRTVEIQAHDRGFLTDNCDNSDELLAYLANLNWEDIEAKSGVGRAQIHQIADHYARAQNVVFGWTMGITHHTHGVANVEAIANLALLRGMVGKPHAGLLPIRGHSNVQGVGSMGVTPELKRAAFTALEDRLNVKLPTTPGWDTMACMEAAHSREAKFGFCLGGNLYGSNPDSGFAAEALGALDTLVHLNTTLNTGHTHGLARQTLILPVLPRDEEPQPTTQESMFNYVRVSDGGPARHLGPRSEVQVIADLAARLLSRQTTSHDPNRQSPALDESDGSAHPNIGVGPSAGTLPSSDSPHTAPLASPGPAQPDTDRPDPTASRLGAVDWSALRNTESVRALIADVVPGTSRLVLVPIPAAALAPAPTPTQPLMTRPSSPLLAGSYIDRSSQRPTLEPNCKPPDCRNWSADPGNCGS